MTLAQIDKLSVRRGGHTVVDQVSFDVAPGEFIGLLGPNGAGKTTLMRAALGLLDHDGQSSLSTLPVSLRAQQVAWMPQTREIAWPIDVETLVALGRIPHLPTGGRIRENDRSRIDQAIEKMGLNLFRGRKATQLSGGEQARVLIARALAQGTPLLFADEPIAGLDPANQISTMQIFADLAREDRSIVTSLHDLGLAARHCNRLLLLNNGKLVADGAPQDVLTPQNVQSVFGITSHFERTEHGLVFMPLETLA